jgi:hypothetical protein
MAAVKSSSNAVGSRMCSVRLGKEVLLDVVEVLDADSGAARTVGQLVS